MNKNITVKDYKMYEDKTDFGDTIYCLSITYVYEDYDGIYELVIPKIILPIRNGEKPIRHTDPSFFNGPSTGTIILGSSKFRLGSGIIKNNDLDGGEQYDLYSIRKVKEKEKIVDITIKEIEEKLGYKINIIDKKED